MPIYEFRCTNGHTFEVMRPISADPLTACETCSAPVERVFHPIAVHFKGSGFYNTDYGTKKRSREAKEYKESNKSEKSEKSETSKDGGAKNGASSGSSSSDSGSSSSNSGSASKSDSGTSKAPSKSSSD